MNNSNLTGGLATETAGAQACTPENRILEHLQRSATEHHQTKSRDLNRRLTYDIRQRIQGPATSCDPVLRVTLDHLGARESSNLQRAIQSLAADLENYQIVLGDFLPLWLVEMTNQQIRQRAYDEGTNSNASLDLPEFFARLDRQDSLATHFSTGIDTLDHDLNGGIDGLTLILGDKGVGKTSLLLSCIMSTLEDPDACVLFYSLDMPKDQIYSRICCRQLRTSPFCFPWLQMQKFEVTNFKNCLLHLIWRNRWTMNAKKSRNCRIFPGRWRRNRSSKRRPNTNFMPGKQRRFLCTFDPFCS